MILATFILLVVWSVAGLHILTKTKLQLGKGKAWKSLLVLFACGPGGLIFILWAAFFLTIMYAAYILGWVSEALNRWIAGGT